MSSSAVISIHSEYASRIYDGSKAFEFRKTKLSRPVSRLYLYETGESGQVTGYANMKGVIEGRPADIWAITKAKAGITYSQFRSYFKGAKTAYAYCLNGGHRFESPLKLSDFGIARAPQSLQYVSDSASNRRTHDGDIVIAANTARFFISGVHGVGKTTLASELARCTGMSSYSSGGLICEEGAQLIGDKAVKAEHVDNNQSMLLKAIAKTKWFDEGGFLDGHFTLLDDAGDIKPVAKSVFEDLRIDAIILVRKRTEIIVSQMINRDGKTFDRNTIKRMQEVEELRAREIAKCLKIPFGIVDGELAFS